MATPLSGSTAAVDSESKSFVRDLTDWFALAFLTAASPAARILLGLPGMRSIALILISISLLGCAVPLGRGFNHAFRSVDVSATSIEPTHIHVSILDKLQNVGDRTLTYLDVHLPNGPSFGTRDVNIMVDGKAVASRTVTEQSGPSLRIPFDPPWPERQEREISFAYDLEPAPEGRGVVAATPDGFYLADANAFPAWQPPLGPFAQASLRAKTEELEVTVPADFRVLAMGRERGSTRRGEAVVHRFETLQAEFPPYLVAGLYQERRVETQHGTVIFWTRESLDESSAQKTAERLSSAVITYEEAFGAITRNRFPVHVVETSAELAPIVVVTPNISAASFPEGVLFDHRAIALGLASGPVLDLADYELARTWFGWHVRPRPEADLLLGRGMALFAALHAAESRGGSPARQEEIARLIATYDSLGTAKDEKPGFGPLVGYSRQEATAKSYKAALFLLSLEEIAGEEKFHRAVRRVLRDMAGREIGSAELRSAVEAESGQNLAAVFHAWLDQPGLPPDFRARYMAAR